jgi:hypothetical protein
MINIKNYVVGAHRRINSSQWAWKDTSPEGDIYQTYGEMYRLSRSSMRHFLKGEWEEVLHDEDIESIAYAMKLNFTNTYNLWKSEPCNILAVGPDVQIVKPLDIFGGEFDGKFRMFNWTDPKVYHDPNPWGIRLDNYFNGDFKYFPHDMDERLWEKAWERAETWVEDNSMENWGNEQLIENEMFWSQGLSWEEAHRPDLFYQAQWLPWKSVEEMDAWNNYKYEDASVIHWHSSRHSPTKLECMRQVNEGLGVPMYETKLDQKETINET